MNGYSPCPTMNSLKNPQDLPSPIKLESYESIKEQKSHNFGALQSGENFGFLKEWFPISLERLVFRRCDAPLLKGFLGVLVSAPRAQQKSGTLEIIASCSNKKDVEMVTNTVLFINMQLIAILHMYT